MARILVASDGSEAAKTAARRSSELLGPAHDWFVVTVAPEHHTPFLTDGTVSEIQSEEHAAALEACEATIAAMGVDARPLVRFGEESAAIRDAALEEGADVIVLAAARRGGIHRFTSTVRRHLEEHAEVPVLTVPVHPRAS